MLDSSEPEEIKHTHLAKTLQAPCASMVEKLKL